MKSILQIVLLTLLAGCASAPHSQVRQAIQKYQKVNRWTPHGDVYRMLGQPQNKLPDGREQWLVSDGQQSAELLLRFSPNGAIAEMEQHYPLVTQ